MLEPWFKCKCEAIGCMEFEILHRPSYAVLDVELGRGEEVRAARGALLSRSRDVTMEADVGGADGIGGMVRRAVSDDPAPVETTFTAERDGATVTLAPAHPGDVTAVDVEERGPLSVRSAATLAWEPAVEHATRTGVTGSRSGSEGITVLGLSGAGWAFLSSFGAISERVVTPEDPLVADEDHLLAWTAGLDVSRERVGGIRTNTLGGEGSVATLSGDGHVWLQTRTPFRSGPSGTGGDRDARPTERRTDRRTDQRTDRRTDQRTDTR